MNSYYEEQSKFIFMIDKFMIDEEKVNHESIGLV